MTNINKIKIALLGATALFASTSAHAQVADTWSIDGTNTPTTVTSGNIGNVTMNSSDAADGTVGASIVEGQKNSVSATAIGASASSSFTVTSATDSSLTGNILAADGANGVIASSFNGGNVSNWGDISGAAIGADGAGNSISRVALGASASNSASVFVVDGEQASTYTVPSSTVSASNSLAMEALTPDTDGIMTVSNGVNITDADVGGNNNSISAAAIGASASVGASTTILAGSETGVFNLGVAIDPTAPDTAAGAGVISVASLNQANVGVGNSSNDFADLSDPTAIEPAELSANIQDGANASSVSSSAIGSSASVSYAANVFGGDVTNTALIGAFDDGTGVITPGDGVTILSANGLAGDTTADFSNDVTGLAALDTPTTLINATDITAASIGADSSNNSISVAGIGASASMSFAVNDYSGGDSAISNVLYAAAPTITALNGSAVYVGSTITGAEIAGGLQNSVSAAAIGASASQSFSLFTK
ncbi:hypothetical protein [Novosphingobium cyanobacteriorum]|uniref:Uncharacterized protein n=1 Tax=Novosphingobium cyanobacteriorum TaxID=3024215 RepID=A0ABT6CKD2_9SPHN|nr:hypothetical protein [Novosphingobium cyanobacteriorum]MDF8334361.1 hypothetical protein [Novosphingobium cyanobacteriorum]